jgi:protein gp37
MGKARYANGFTLTLQPDVMDLPLKWKRPRRIFVNSMSDLFHKDVPLEYIQQVFQTMVRADQHIFQVLTKRSDRARELSPYLPWPANIWMGVSIENDKYAFRADDLRAIPAAVRFLSCEPLIGPIPSLNVRDLDWVIAGGESGQKFRPLEEAWAVAIRDLCQNERVPFFFKQWGGRNKKATGRLLDGRYWDELPESRSYNDRLCHLPRVA